MPDFIESIGERVEAEAAFMGFAVHSSVIQRMDFVPGTLPGPIVLQERVICAPASGFEFDPEALNKMLNNLRPSVEPPLKEGQRDKAQFLDPDKLQLPSMVLSQIVGNFAIEATTTLLSGERHLHKQTNDLWAECFIAVVPAERWIEPHALVLPGVFYRERARKGKERDAYNRAVRDNISRTDRLKHAFV